MGVTYGNPIVITSGTMNTQIALGNVKVTSLHWYRPTTGSTSSLVISKKNETGDVYHLEECAVSGTSQTTQLPESLWWVNPFCRSVPTGTLYIYLK